jgi:hypothetical protein
MRYFGIVAAIAVCLALAGPAAAVTVSYTVDGWGPTSYPGTVTPPANAPWGVNGYPGDTVELLTYTDTIDLYDGASHTKKINTLLWTVDYTYAGTDDGGWAQLQHVIDANRGISFTGGPVGTLSQTGLLENNWDNDFLSFSQGSVTSFVVGGYRVDVTPLVVAPAGAGGSGGNPWVQPPRDMMAQFVVTELAPVPEPVTMAGLMMGIGGLVTYIRKRRAA